MSNVRAVLGDGGLLSTVIPQFKERPEQIAFSEATDRVLQDSGVLLSECPPGVGKSFGYLVPAIYRIGQTPRVTRQRYLKNGGIEEYQDDYRVLVVTANIALQEQLIHKDLPLLHRLMGVDFQYALAKGRTNYCCYSFVHSDSAFQVEMFDPESAQALHDLIIWARNSQTGDISDLETLPNKSAWAEMSKSSDECLGKKCQHHHDCFVRKAKAKVDSANIVVCNYHLFFSNMAYGMAVLPPYDAVIMDEAHEAVDVARDIFGWRLSHAAIRRAVGPLRLIGLKDTRTTVLDASRDFFKALENFKDSPRYRARIKSKYPVDTKRLVDALKEVLREFVIVREGAPNPERKEEARLWCNKINEIIFLLQEAMNLGNSEAVYFIEGSRGGSYSLNCKTVDVGDKINECLFKVTPSVVLTSATLAVNGKFQYLYSDLGIHDCMVEELVVGSPFDLAKQSLFIIPFNAPSPDNSEVVSQYIEKCVELARGRTLCLFTSYRNLAVARDRLRANTKWNVLAQGEKPRNKLIEEFREDVSSVLLGVDSFWAGIDVPGEALSCVIIDRLPFPNPDDPILDATKDKGEKSWFMDYSIPRAVIAFKQGAGRLIRSIYDKGVIVVLDDRIINKRYGAIFINSFPQRLTIRKDVEVIKEFLA